MPQQTVEIIIAARDSASAVVNSTLRSINSATQSYNSTLERLNGNVQSSVGQLAGFAAQIISVRAAWQGFQSGLKAVDDFRLATIGVAATLTDMAQEGSGDLKQVYADNLKYAEATYQKVELAAAKYFASGKEMVEAWQILAQKGVVVFGQKDIDALGVITDKIKLATAGQASSVQIATELRAVMDGQARAASQIAMMLKDRLGPEWEKQLEKARQEGKILEFLAGQFSGLAYASKDVTNTLEAQKSTLSTLLTQVARGGLSGAYEDIVRWISQANVYLEQHRFIIADRIATAWATVRSAIEGAGSAIKGMNDLIGNSSAAGLALAVAGWGAAFIAVIASVRKFADVIKWGFAIFAANLAWVTTLFSAFMAPFVGIVAAAASVSTALGVVVTGLLAIGLALAVRPLLEWIGTWEIAGNKISEYVEMGQRYLENFGLYLKKFFLEDFVNYAVEATDKAIKAIGGMVAKAGAMLKNLAFPSGAPDPYSDDQSTSNVEGFTPTGASPPPSGESDAEKIRRNINRINLLNQLGKARQSGFEAQGPEADLGRGEGHIKKPGVKTPPPEPVKGAGSAAKKLAEEEIRLAEAMGKAKVRWIEEAMDASKRAYEDGKVSAEDYYAYATALAEAKYQEQLKTIEAEKTAISNAIQTAQAQAESAQEKTAIQVKFEVKRVELEAELAKVRNDYDKAMQGIADDQKKHERERVDAEVSVLRELVNQEVISDADRKIVGDAYLSARTQQIRMEAEEWKKKGVESIRVEQWAVAEIKKAQQELTRFNLAELQNMLNDIATTAADKERIWREVNNRIASGEVDPWTAFKLGMQNTGTHFNNFAQDMLESGKVLATGLRDGFKNLFVSTLKGDFSTFQDWFKGFVDTLLAQWTETLANMLAKWIMNTEAMKSLGLGLSSLLGFSGIGGGAIGGETPFASGGTATFITPIIPAFASGGVVSRPSLAMIGEGKHKEAIVPLPDGRAIPAIVTDAGQGSASNNLTTHIQITVPPPTTNSGQVDTSGAAEYGRMVGEAFKAEFAKHLNEHMRPGGLLNQTRKY